MNFTTKVPLTKSQYPITYQSEVVSLGSCFAENIGEKFEYFKFKITTNPFGIIFNPISIERLVERAVNQQLFAEKDIFFHNDLWHSFELHSALSHPEKTVFLDQLNQIVRQFHRQLRQASHVIITYGTSWVYRHRTSGELVANCHKVPQKEFTKEILSPETIRHSIQNTMALIQKGNPKVQFIFTISPVRHLKDGFAENQRSKAHLITALHHLSLGIDQYFPSYEIMMDELRDYRFYAEDLLHPSQIAIDYIWERFLENHISIHCIGTMQDVSTIQKGLTHRPFNPNTASHQQFLNTLNQKIIKLQAEFPHFQF